MALPKTPPVLTRISVQGDRAPWQLQTPRCSGAAHLALRSPGPGRRQLRTRGSSFCPRSGLGGRSRHPVRRPAPCTRWPLTAPGQPFGHGGHGGHAGTSEGRRAQWLHAGLGCSGPALRRGSTGEKATPSPSARAARKAPLDMLATLARLWRPAETEMPVSLPHMSHQHG